MKTKQTTQYELAPLSELNPQRRKAIMAELDYEVTHEKGGNGWAIVHDMGNEFVRIVELGVDCLKQAYVVWSGMLTVSQVPSQADLRVLEKKRLSLTLEPLVKRLRDDLKTGRVECISPWIYDKQTGQKVIYKEPPKRKAA